MADKNTIDQVTEAYNSIHAAILAALAVATDQTVVTNLVYEDRAAYAAFTNAMASTFTSSDPAMASMMQQLSGATKAVNDTSATIDNIVSVAGQIDKAVGVLAKIAAFVTTSA